jgi:tetratricopeptide (TPR) repeat protein
MAGAHIKAKDVPAGLACYGKAQMESYDKAVERKIKTLELEEKKRKIKEYINPEEGLAAKERGNASFRDGDFPTAIKEYEDATKRDPTNAPYHNNLAAAYLKVLLCFLAVCYFLSFPYLTFPFLPFLFFLFLTFPLPHLSSSSPFLFFTFPLPHLSSSSS